MRQLAALLCAAVLPACGEATYIVLEVQSSLEIPDQINTLQIEIISHDDQEELLSLDLGIMGEDFPIEVVFEPSDETPEQLEVKIIGRLDSEAVAQIRVLYGWEVGAINRVAVPPLEVLR